MPPSGAAPAQALGGAPRRAMTLTAVICTAAAAGALVVGSLLGQPLAGAALALGLMLGAGNGLMARRLLVLGAAFAATSLARLMALSAVAVASGIFLGFNRVVLVLAGLAAAQLVLSAAAAREMIWRR
jgi:hypothetical protein